MSFLSFACTEKRKHGNHITQISRGFELLLLFSMAEQREININGNRNVHVMKVTCDGAINIQLSNRKEKEKRRKTRFSY